MTPSDPAGSYLIRRRLEPAIRADALRYRRDTPHPAGGGRLPALLARIDAMDGAMIGVQRIYLRAGGTKADVDPAKAVKGRLWGGAVRLGTGPEISVAEGPETAIAAGLILGLPAWSAISAGNLARGLMLPLDVRRVVIAADRDKAGIEAARAAAARWQREGRTVRIATPDDDGADFADVQMRRVREIG